MVEKRDKHHRLVRIKSATASSWGEPIGQDAENTPSDVDIDCGWGRLIFAHTFDDPERLADALGKEQSGRRDIALYVRNPHVVLSIAPQKLFLDPSDTYRLWMSDYTPPSKQGKGFVIRRLRTRADATAINRIYATRHMVQAPDGFIWKNRSRRELTYLVAEDEKTGEIIGTATGVDHVNAFNDPENGSSLWCLAVDPQSPMPGVGKALTDYLIGHFQARGRSFMDLSVLHENRQAIALYEKMGFQRIPAFCIKLKNPINEPLFTGLTTDSALNPYAQIIVDEALRRGIAVNVDDAENGFFELTFGGRQIACRESLSELTTAVAMSRCDDKQVTARLLEQAGLQVPRQQIAGAEEDNTAFLEKCEAVVVKPASGEQGKGVHVNITDAAALEKTITTCRKLCDKVLIEEYQPGEDLRIIVIDGEVVAAAVRKPPRVVGTGQHTVRTLIEKQSRRREAATKGESHIPLDRETERCIVEGGYGLDDILPAETVLQVRETANLHTGGTIHDVTDQIHPALKQAAISAARAIDIPVVGLDFIVHEIEGPDYAIIEANERPGLANHEPQPTAERFIDLLFPQTVTRKTDRKHSL